MSRDLDLHLSDGRRDDPGVRATGHDRGPGRDPIRGDAQSGLDRLPSSR